MMNSYLIPHRQRMHMHPSLNSDRAWLTAASLPAGSWARAGAVTEAEATARATAKADTRWWRFVLTAVAR